MDEKKLRQYVEESKSIKEVLTKMEITNYHSGYNIFQRNIKKYKINISHFLSKKELMIEKYTSGKLKKIPINLMLVENSTYTRCSVKRRIINEKLLTYKCVFYDNEGEWMGKEFSLILDHKNGKNNDHRLENLRFVCPNCNATLDTHCGRNKKQKKKLKEEKKKYAPRFERRKVIRPDMSTLIKQVNEFGYVKTGKIYGVSDNAIRKWLKPQ